MPKLVKTKTGFKLSSAEDKVVTLHHSDGDWIVLKENQNCYLLHQGPIYSVRTKDPEGRVGFYTGDCSSSAYDAFTKVGEMDLSVRGLPRDI